MMFRTCFDEDHDLFWVSFRAFLERKVRPKMARWRDQGTSRVYTDARISRIFGGRQKS